MTINTLLFDLDNTLIMTHKLLETWVNAVDKDAFEIFYPKSCYQNTDDPRVQKQLFKRLQDKMGKVNYQLDFERYLLNEIQPDSKQIAFLQGLATEYKMAIVSNGRVKKQQQKIAKSGLKPVFQAYIISGERGIRKPQAGIFKQALKQLDSKPEESLFIGDSLENDIKGADMMGIRTCWLNRHKIPEDFPIKPGYHIKTLYEMKQIVQKRS